MYKSVNVIETISSTKGEQTREKKMKRLLLLSSCSTTTDYDAKRMKQHFHRFVIIVVLLVSYCGWSIGAHLRRRCRCQKERNKT